MPTVGQSKVYGRHCQIDKVKQKKIIAYLKTHDYGNEMEVEKLYKLI